RWIAVEAPLPERMAEDCNRRGTRLFRVRWRKEPADMRTRAEHGEVVQRHHVAEDAFRAVRSAEAHWLGTETVRIDALEHGVAGANVKIVRVRPVVEAMAVLRAADVDEPAGIHNTGRRLEEQGVGNGEDRRVRADANGQGEHRSQSEQRIAHEQT